MFIIARIEEVKDNFVRVKYQDTISPFIPYLQSALGEINISFKPKKGSIVIYYSSIDFSFAFGALAHMQQESKNEISFKDGLNITYDEDSKTLSIDSIDNLTIKTKSEVILESPSVTLGKNTTALDGVVTGACLCAFTGAPHADYSSSIKAKK